MNEDGFTRQAKDSGNRLTLSMIIHNEEDNYLKMVLEAHREYIDDAVIIDDSSTDSSVQICADVLKDIPYHIIHNSVSKFSNEVELRKQQWDETVKTDPDWILNVDADHMFEKKFKDKVRELINQTTSDVICFRLYDFWDKEHYRDDQYWFAHNTYRPFLTRYQKGYNYQWLYTPQHCGHFPKNIFGLPSSISDIRLKHFGWADSTIRLERYKRYLKLDPDFRYGWREQIQSVLDENPNLVKWEE